MHFIECTHMDERASRIEILDSNLQQLHKAGERIDQDGLRARRHEKRRRLVFVEMQKSIDLEDSGRCQFHQSINRRYSQIFHQRDPFLRSAHLLD
ncbi:hypothetical protein GCM10011507_35140 [Edaphobacter acidisoli]|uniref:Uncharacterized protein n=1 Tax=Edaphobacter acidisoli TaxID=2040573 RepID=A0A916S4P5_9BACT|nr:hypothetical protein GCM10011507_35140 [Edaphobacter acidisoli]